MRPSRNPFCLSEAELRQRRSLKWCAYPPQVLPLWVAEMDARTPEAVRATLVEALERGDTGYPYGTDYAEALLRFAAARWGWTFDPQPVAVVADVMTGIGALLRLLTDERDPVIVTPPVYPPFFAVVTGLGRRVVSAPLGQDFRLDLGALQAAFAAAARPGRRAVLLLCNPHNPTGTVHSATELAEVAALAERYGVRVVADEIHAPLTYPDAAFVPYLTVPGAATAVAVFSAAKGWNLAGLKAALLVPGAGAVDDLARLPVLVRYGPSHFGVLAHTAALLAGQDWLAEHLSGLDENRRRLADLLAERLPEVGYRLPQATYLAWLDCRSLGLGDDPAQVFLDRGFVALNPGPTFGAGGQGFVRLNFATSPEILAEAVNRMARAASLGRPTS